MVEIVEVDLSISEQADSIVRLLNAYACDDMGGGKPLPESVRHNLVACLKRCGIAHVVLAYVDGTAAGLAICFEGFSTFSGQPLLNIHDMMVAAPYRGRGLSKMILAKVEEIAAQLGCCKLTLEVLEGNPVAQAAYRTFGFSDYQLDPQMGRALFWEKKLEQTS